MIIKALNDLIKLLDEKPRVVFIVLTVLFGAGLTYAILEVITLSTEVGGLRAQTLLMHEMITERCK